MGFMQELKRMDKHLCVVVSATGEPDIVRPIHDPFVTVNVVSNIKLTWLEWIKMAFGVAQEFRCHIRVEADGVAVQRWVQRAVYCDKCKEERIDHPSADAEHDHGYHHGHERWCKKCYYA